MQANTNRILHPHSLLVVIVMIVVSAPTMTSEAFTATIIPASFRTKQLPSQRQRQQQHNTDKKVYDCSHSRFVTRTILDMSSTNADTASSSSSSPSPSDTNLNNDDDDDDARFQSAIDNDIILFDGVCNFCNTWVDLLLRIDVRRKFRFAPLQSDLGRRLLVRIGRAPDDISSVVLVRRDPGDRGSLLFFDKSRCVLRVVEELGWPARIAARAAERVVPEAMRDSIYDTVAENRYNLLGKRDECRCSDPNYADRFLV